ncbi:MAG: disulfide bond formation protein DsbA, partial [Myxococcales bacterium FL481]
NEGRQRLNGNVGFRIIEANVRELLRHTETEHSWC